MPIIKSAKKALRQSKTRKARNVVKKKDLKVNIKIFRKAVETNNLEEAKKKLPLVYKKLDKAAKTNLIKKGKADRLKSRLAKKLSVKK